MITGNTTGINRGSSGRCRFCGTVTVPHFTVPRGKGATAFPHVAVHGSSTNFGVVSFTTSFATSFATGPCALAGTANDNAYAVTAYAVITFTRNIQPPRLLGRVVMVA